MSVSKKVTSAILITTILSSNAMALPQDGVVTSGSVNINTTGNIMNVDQSTAKASIDWNSFNIGQRETVNFNSANASDITINRVTGGGPGSVIAGMLNSNHNVVLLDDSGITFTKTARVNVGSLIAATTKSYNIYGDVLAFDKISGAKITNDGTITTAEGGVVFMIANQVENNGSITANKGEVALGSAKVGSILLTGSKGGRINYEVNTDYAEESGITNNGVLTAHNGLISLTTKQANNLGAGVINLSGIVDASSFGLNANGGTVLVNSSGNINSDAFIDASGTASSGTIFTIADGSNNFSGEYTSQGSSGMAAIDGGVILIKGNDVSYNGKINTASMDPNRDVVTEVKIESDTGFTIKNGNTGAGQRNVLTESILESLGQHADVTVSAKDIIINNLADNVLDMKNNITLGSSSHVSDMYNNAVLIANDKNDTIKGKGVVADMTGKIDIGNIEAERFVILGNGDYLAPGTANGIKVHDIKAGEFIDIRSNGNDITTGNLSVTANTPYAGSDIYLYSYGGDVTTGDIDVFSTAYNPLGGTRATVYAIAENLQTGKAGDIKLGNISLETKTTTDAYSNLAAAYINGNEVATGNINLKAATNAGASSPRAGLYVTADQNVSTGGINAYAGNTRNHVYGQNVNPNAEVDIATSGGSVNIHGDIIAKAVSNTPQTSANGASITIDATKGQVLLDAGNAINVSSAYSSGGNNGGKADIKIIAGPTPPIVPVNLLTGSLSGTISIGNNIIPNAPADAIIPSISNSLVINEPLVYNVSASAISPILQSTGQINMSIPTLAANNQLVKAPGGAQSTHVVYDSPAVPKGILTTSYIPQELVIPVVPTSVNSGVVTTTANTNAVVDAVKVTGPTSSGVTPVISINNGTINYGDSKINTGPVLTYGPQNVSINVPEVIVTGNYSAGSSGNIGSNITLGPITQNQPVISTGPVNGNSAVIVTTSEPQPITLTNTASPITVTVSEGKFVEGGTAQDIIPIKLASPTTIATALEANQKVAVLNAFTNRSGNYSLNVNFVGPIQP